MKLALLAAVILAATVHGGPIVFNDLGPGNTYMCCTGDGARGTSIVSGPLATADPFIPSSTVTFGELLIALSLFPGGNDVAIISLVADTGGTPTGTVLESWTSSSMPGFGFSNNVVQTFVANSTATLMAGTQYWVVIAPQNPSTDVVWNGPLTPDPLTEEYNAGSGWTPKTGSVAFEVLDSSVLSPEPGSMLLLGTGILSTIAKKRYCGRRFGRARN